MIFKKRYTKNAENTIDLSKIYVNFDKDLGTLIVGTDSGGKAMMTIKEFAVVYGTIHKTLSFKSRRALLKMYKVLIAVNSD